MIFHDDTAAASAMITAISKMTLKVARHLGRRSSRQHHTQPQ
jgi:hypothetical protein